MKTPPLLLGCALAFWGWQADFLWTGVALGALIESAWLIPARFEISDDDFKRIWTFCLLAMFAALLYVFNDNGGPASLGGLAETPTRYGAQRAVGNASSATALTGLRWSPMIFFLFVLAQAFSTREKILLATVSPFFWRRRAEAKKFGEDFARGRQFNPAWPFFALCLLASSLHKGEVHEFFWGFALLVAWALWPWRARRFSLPLWVSILACATVVAFGGQRGVGNFQLWLTRMNAAWLADMMARRGVDATKATTSIGSIGRLAQSGRIVIRLRTPPGAPPPPLLREASYTSFRRDTWLIPRALSFNEVAEQASLTDWNLLPQKKTSASVTIASYLNRRRDLLPLPGGTARLAGLDMEAVRTNSFGAVQAEGKGLAIFDAHYAPGATIDSPPDGLLDFNIPREESNAVAQVCASLKIADDSSDAAKLEAVRKFFAGNFSYSIWQEQPRHNGGTPVRRFLLETRKGHCEFFATATVLMLRRLGVPARYAIGYAVHEAKGADNFVVRQRDGHAWCLAWNADKKIWEDFDTTPGDFIAEEAKRASSFEFIGDAWSWAWFEFSKFRWGQTQWREYILWGLLPVLGLLLFQIVRQARRRKNSGAEKFRHDWPGLDSEFYRLVEKIGELAGPRAPDEPLARWLGRAAELPALAGSRETFDALLALHYRLRFDPRGLDAAERAALRRECVESLASLRRGD